MCPPVGPWGPRTWAAASGPVANRVRNELAKLVGTPTSGSKPDSARMRPERIGDAATPAAPAWASAASTKADPIGGFSALELLLEELLELGERFRLVLRNRDVPFPERSCRFVIVPFLSTTRGGLAELFSK